MSYEKLCGRPGCCATIIESTPSRLKRRKYHSLLCKNMAVSKILTDRYSDQHSQELAILFGAIPITIKSAPNVVRCPDNDPVHKKAQQEQLEMIYTYLGRKSMVA